MDGFTVGSAVASYLARFAAWTLDLDNCRMQCAVERMQEVHMGWEADELKFRAEQRSRERARRVARVQSMAADGLSKADIARVLGVTVPTVNKLLDDVSERTLMVPL